MTVSHFSHQLHMYTPILHPCVLYLFTEISRATLRQFSSEVIGLPRRVPAVVVTRHQQWSGNCRRHNLDTVGLNVDNLWLQYLRLIRQISSLVLCCYCFLTPIYRVPCDHLSPLPRVPVSGDNGPVLQETVTILSSRKVINNDRVLSLPSPGDYSFCVTF